MVVLAAVAGAGVGGWGWLAQHPSAVEPPLAPAPTAAADSALPTPAVDPPIVATEDLASLAVPPATDSSGRVIVRADTVGARVWIDNVYRGRTPLTVADLPAGRHVVTVEGPAGRVRRVVEVKAGSTAPLLVPTSAAEPGAVAVTAPAEVEVREGGRVLGSSRAERILLDPGTHTLELVNEAIGYESRRVVEIVPGRTTSIALTFPDGALSLNALPWAEVFVDGRRIGETPIGNLKVAVGPHQVTFRHPELGEVTRSVDVTLRGPTRVSVNLERKER